MLLFRKPFDERLAPCAQRVRELLDGDYDVNVQMMAASTLFNYINWRTDGEMAPALVAQITPVLARPEVTPLMQVWWRTHLSFWHYLNGRYDESTKVTAEARAIAERYGLEAYLFEIDHAETSALISNGDYAVARQHLDEMGGARFRAGGWIGRISISALDVRTEGRTLGAPSTTPTSR